MGEAKDLKPGQSLLTAPDGTLQRVVAVDNFTGVASMRDLTVDSVHTYYVIADDAPILVHNNDSNDSNADECPVFDQLHNITDGELNSPTGIGYKYQIHVTDSSHEQWYKDVNGSLIKPDGGPDPHGYPVEAKWTGADDGWAKSRYNPNRAGNRFNADDTISQAQRLLQFNRARGGNGVRWATSSTGGADFYRDFMKKHFPAEMESGELAVWHVSARGMN